MSLSCSVGSSAGSPASRPKVNLRSTAVKRIMQEAAELASEDTMEEDFVAAPLESDIFEWHCTMRGVAGSEYEGGIYHFRIVLPASYPMSPPDILLLTPNGRFELSKKICIDGLTSFHVGSWQPAWGVRTAILGLRSFWMQQQGEALAAVGAMNCGEAERRRLAVLSREWKCPTCQVCNKDILPDRPRVEGDQRGPAETVDSHDNLSTSGKEEEGNESGTSRASDSTAAHVVLARPDSINSDRTPIEQQAPIDAEDNDTAAGPSSLSLQMQPLFSKIPVKSRSEGLPSRSDLSGGALSGLSRPAPDLTSQANSANDARDMWSAMPRTVTPPIPAIAHGESDLTSDLGASVPAPAVQPTARQPREPAEQATYARPQSPPAIMRPTSVQTRRPIEARGRITPFWLDAAIVGLGALVVALLARRLYLGDPDLDGALRASLTDL